MSNRYPKIPLNQYSNSPDLQLHVNGVPFHLHKETLAKRSAKVKRLLDSNKLDELRWNLRDMEIHSDTFQLVARFCYGYDIKLSSENILSVLYLAYYLEMSDDHSTNNLFNKAITFLQQRVLTSWSETLKALSMCSGDKALRRLVGTGIIEILFDSLVKKAVKVPSLIHDLVMISHRLYEPLMVELSNHNVSSENIAISVCNYAKVRVFEKDSRDESGLRQKREVLEAVERVLPHRRGTISCGFLFKLLKEAIFLDACSDCRKGFEVRISNQLDMATGKDLLILSPKEDGSYDIELLKTILKNFYTNYNNVSDVLGFVNVARMLEDFLFEAASSDASLKVITFKSLAEIAVAASCEVMRHSDGIYRAINVYLERHRDLIESEKMEVCRVLEFEKLSSEACEHASKNEKLPLRIVMRVLYVSQMQIRDTVAREMKEVEMKSENQEDDDMESDEGKMLIEKLDCAEMKMKEKKRGVWREMKRKFGCMSSSTRDAYNSHKKKNRYK